MNRRTVIDLDDIPSDVMELLQEYLDSGDVEPFELTRRYCLDCGIRWRSARQHHSAETEQTLAQIYRNARVHWSYQEAGYD